MAGYKAKTIKSILSKKLNKWVESIEDEDLRKDVKKHTIITGGCIVSMLQGEPVNDFDVYFTNHDTVKNVAEYYTSKFKDANGEKGFKLTVEDRDGRVRIVAKSVGVVGEQTTSGEYTYFEGRPDDEAATYRAKVMDNPEEIEDAFEDVKMEIAHNPEEVGKYRPVFLSSNAITLSDKIQVVLRFYGAPDEIHENYDFVHCTSYWTSADNKLVLRPEALESILSKELRYVGSKYPICSIVRLRKFIARGWRINAGQILKMCIQVSNLDLTDVETLSDQLVGCDTAYFIQLINKLKEKDPDKVDAGYVIEIVDRIF